MIDTDEVTTVSVEAGAVTVLLVYTKGRIVAVTLWVVAGLWIVVLPLPGTSLVLHLVNTSSA